MREELDVSPHLSSALLLLLLPLLLGLVPVSLLSMILNILKPGWNHDRTVISDILNFLSIRMLFQRSTRRLANMMTVLSTLFYLMNMVVAELLFDHISIAVFVTLKHILPYLVNIAVPVLVLVTQDDIRSEAQVIDTHHLLKTHTPPIQDTHYIHHYNDI